MKYVRFVTDWTTEDGYEKCGLLLAACNIRDRFFIAHPEFLDLCEQIDWFIENLAVPDMFGDPVLGRTESWFLESAIEHIQRAEKLGLFLNRVLNVQTSVRCQSEIGQIHFRDEHQVLVSKKSGD